VKSLYSILLLSIIGYFISLFSISSLNKYLFFFQQWSFLQCLILGIILSATRPITLMRQAGLSLYFYNTNSNSI
jgi:NhaP-type Na+/H+ or K+/H+ antiporter